MLPARIATGIEVDDAGCWLWTKALTSAGYGETWDGESVVLVHRYVYQLLVGPIPPGMVIDHLCRVSLCTNPAHLDVVSQGENVRRGNAGKPQHEKSMSATHCSAGHSFVEFGSWVKTPERSSGKRRVCRECRNIRQRAWRAQLAG